MSLTEGVLARVMRGDDVGEFTVQVFTMEGISGERGRWSLEEGNGRKGSNRGGMKKRQG